jgi:leucine dehydrogenase
MKIFDYMKKYDFEQLIFNYDETSGLKALICIHDTTLGPALGGTRMWVYEKEEDAIEDVFRLARGMTYKAAVAGLNLGGGKGVVIGDPKKKKSEELWRSFGRFVQSLNGRYITAKDVGTDHQDLNYISMETDYVVGLMGTSGDPSPFTANGVWHGMQACAEIVYGNRKLKGKKVAVQGVGNVGYHLVKHLVKDEGAEVTVTDIDQERVRKVVDEFSVKAVKPEKIYSVDMDIFAPCALGAVINDETLPRLRCQIIAGGANNVLAEERHGEEAEKMGIFYAPDYVINAGGLINVADELKGYDKERALQAVAGIYDSIMKVMNIAKRDNIPTSKAADRMAEERIQIIGKTRNNYINR